MQLPIVAPAPMVTIHADVFRSLCGNRRHLQSVQNCLTALTVLDNKASYSLWIVE